MNSGVAVRTSRRSSRRAPRAGRRGRAARRRAPTRRAPPAARGRADRRRTTRASRIEEARPRGRHDQPAAAGRGATGTVEEGEQVAARPVHVLDEPDRRATGERIERSDPRREPRVPFRREVASGGARDPRPRSTRRVDLGDDDVCRDHRQRRPRAGRSGAALVDGARGGEQLGDRLVRRGRLRSNACAEDGRARRRTSPPSSARRRLFPTPGGATISDRLRDVRSRSPSRIASSQPGELSAPAEHERRTQRAHARPRATAAARGPTRAPRADRLGLALQLERPDADRSRSAPPRPAR